MRLCVAGVLVLLQLLAVRGLYINEAVSKMYHAHLKSTEAELYKHTPVVCARGDQCDYAIVLIEPRTLPDAVALAKYVVYNVMYFIQLKTQFTWSVQIFCTQSNLEQMRDIFADVPNIVFTTQEEVPFEGTHFDPSNPTAPAIWMNYFFMSPLVWDAMVPVVRDHILFLHTDCLLLRPGIDEYMQYDYLGAPWDMGGNPKTTRSSDGGIVGNGGFSIRSISTMKRCVAPGGVIARAVQRALPRRANPGPEDGYLATCVLDDPTTKLATRDVALSFSVEVFPHPFPLGVHKMYGHLKMAQVKELLSKMTYSGKEGETTVVADVGIAAHPPPPPPPPPVSSPPVSRSEEDTTTASAPLDHESLSLSQPSLNLLFLVSSGCALVLLLHVLRRRTKFC